MPDSAAASEVFDMRPYTSAPLRLDMRLRFAGHSPAEVFGIMGDPQRITDWYLLARDVRLLPPAADGSANFDVVFTFFGQVHEEILHWDLPRRYVYSASGPDFPIRDYVALIEIQPSGPDRGTLVWQQYFDQIEGEHFQRLLPVILPPINQASLERLATLIGGSDVQVSAHF